MKTLNNPWVTNALGAAGDSAFEISVVRDANDFGKKTYGWFGEDKLLISHSGGPCQTPVSDFVWGKLIESAKATAAFLNKSKPIAQ